MAEPAAKVENKENTVKVITMDQKVEEEEESYEFNPVCENCAG